MFMGGTNRRKPPSSHLQVTLFRVFRRMSLSLVLCMLVMTPTVRAATWDLAADFSTPSNTNNPNGQWSYGWEANPASGSLTLYNTFVADFQFLGSYRWYDSNHTSGGILPAVWENATNSFVINPADGYTITGPYEVVLHPGEDESLSVVRWTSPYNASSNVTVSAMFGAGDLGAMSYYVYYDGQVQWSKLNDPNSETFSSNFTLGPYGTIDFAVGTLGSYSYGTTPLDLTITSGVPEPCTMLLFGSGLVGLAAYRRKFRA